MKTRFFMKQNEPQARLIKQYAPQADFFDTQSSWVLCSVNAVCNSFPTNHSSESFSFNNKFITYFIYIINLAYSTFV